MALSECERRRLEEIERSLHRDDPALATILVSGVVRRHRRVVAAVVFGGGLGALVAGAVTAGSLPAVGVVMSVLGFAAMVGGAGLFFSGPVHARALRPPAAQVRVMVRLARQNGGLVARPLRRPRRIVRAGKGCRSRAGPILRVVRFLMLKDDRDEGSSFGELKITINRPCGPG